jgi:hypothetical protein
LSFIYTATRKFVNEGPLLSGRQPAPANSASLIGLVAVKLFLSPRRPVPPAGRALLFAVGAVAAA